MSNICKYELHVVILIMALHLTRGLRSSVHYPIDVGEVCGVHDNNPLNGDREVRASSPVKSAFAGEVAAHLALYLIEGEKCKDQRRRK
jgi:hypothetical protein